MDNKNAQFAGWIPAAYDRYLGPILFQPYAEDLAARLQVDANGSVLELACGTGILTRILRDRLPATARLVATDLNEPMLQNAAQKFRQEGQQDRAKARPDVEHAHGCVHRPREQVDEQAQLLVALGNGDRDVVDVIPDASWFAPSAKRVGHRIVLPALAALLVPS